MTADERWGPLAALAGKWEGSEGLDVAFCHAENKVLETPFREEITFEPFGPVDNGSQQMFGLDYRMTAWPNGEAEPFHMEIGYWLWEPKAQEVYRCFMVPRTTTLLAMGSAAADSTAFRLEARNGETTNGILSNPYLQKAARCTRYWVDVRIEGDAFSYEETTELQMTGRDEPLAHTDRNRLTRVG